MKTPQEYADAFDLSDIADLGYGLTVMDENTIRERVAALVQSIFEELGINSTKANGEHAESP